MNIYAFQSTLMLVVLVVLLAVKGFAFINALTYSAEAYEAAGKLTKQAWCAITGLGFAAQLILIGSSPLGIIQPGLHHRRARLPRRRTSRAGRGDLLPALTRQAR